MNSKDSEEGIFANEDAVHSILNYIGIQVVNSWFGSEVYTNKLDSESKGRVDFTIKNKNTGLIIEVKYGGNADEALAQAKTYGNLISDQQDQIFIGLDISTSKEVSLAGEIHIGRIFIISLMLPVVKLIPFPEFNDANQFSEILPYSLKN